MRRASSLDNVQPRERFHNMIMRERARVDRNQHPFSLVLFNVGDPKANSARVEYLAHVLANRVRLTDEVGWFDNQHIGTLLPDTSMAGAQRLADDIYQAIANKTSPPECSVYTYPAKWLSNGNGHSAQLHFSDFSPEWKTTTSRDFSAPVKQPDGGNRIFGTQQPSTNTTLTCGTLAQAIEPFFLHPLPVWKRAMDVVGALFGLVVLSPILLLATLIIKTLSPGPVFFKQPRVGRSGKVFTMLKFRTMKHGTDNSAHQQHMSRLINGEGSGRPMSKLDNNGQIAVFGTILRKTSIDELPQLINVLRGEMSLVGPRPPIPYEVEEYSQWHYARFNAVPGMTGLWQVSGKNRLSFLEMVRLDTQYLRKLSLWSDIMILLKTPLAIFSDIKGSSVLQENRLLFKKVVENA